MCVLFARMGEIVNYIVHTNLLQQAVVTTPAVSVDSFAVMFM